MANMDKVKEIFKNAADMEELNKCTNVEESMAFLNGKGAEFTEEDVKELAAAVMKAAEAKNEEMNLDDMDHVAGGGFFGALFGGIGDLIAIPADWGKKLTTTVVTNVVDFLS